MFPTLETENLLGDKVVFPADLPGDPTLVLVAFERGQQSDIDAWVTALDLKGDSPIAWLELPVVGGKARFIKPLLDGWMRDGIPDLEAQARVFTVYSSRKRFRRDVGMEKARAILALVVQPDGVIVSAHQGPPTPASMAATRTAFALQ
ncbi:MAG: hypothetical protein AAF337_09045 [Pseudomonadota bacterium]